MHVWMHKLRMFNPAFGSITSSINRKYITYRNAARRGPSKDRTCISTDMYADRQTHKHTHTDTVVTILRSPVWMYVRMYLAVTGIHSYYSFCIVVVVIHYCRSTLSQRRSVFIQLRSLLIDHATFTYTSDILLPMKLRTYGAIDCKSVYYDYFF